MEIEDKMKTRDEIMQTVSKAAYWAAWNILDDKKRMKDARWIIRNYARYYEIIRFAEAVRELKIYLDFTEKEYRHIAYEMLENMTKQAIEDDKRGVLPMSNANGDLITQDNLP